jgi:hypothetical protein
MNMLITLSWKHENANFAQVETFLRNVNAVTNPTMHLVSAAEAMMRARYVDTFAHPDVICVSGYDCAPSCGDLGDSG